MFERLLVIAGFGQKRAQQSMSGRRFFLQPDGSFELRLSISQVSLSMLNEAEQKSRFEVFRLCRQNPRDTRFRIRVLPDLEIDFREQQSELEVRRLLLESCLQKLQA